MNKIHPKKAVLLPQTCYNKGILIKVQALGAGRAAQARILVKKDRKENFMAVKVFFYTLRPYDEQGILEDLAKQRGIEYGYTEAYPTMEKMHGR
jgi:hypothetical protein